MDQRITEVTYIPDGMAWDDYDVHSFCVRVQYRGDVDGKPRFAVLQGAGDYRQLSRAGNWGYAVPKFKQHQYRWETVGEAMQWAERVVNDVKVNGRTWAEWEAWRAAQRDTADE